MGLHAKEKGHPSAMLEGKCKFEVHTKREKQNQFHATCHSWSDKQQHRMNYTTPLAQVSRSDSHDSGKNRNIIPGVPEDISESYFSIMDNLESDDKMVTHDKDKLVLWIWALQDQVRKLEESSVWNTREILRCAQMQCERDEQTYHWINALVTDKIFLFKKFIVN